MDCPVCREKRYHLPHEWVIYHPLAGHGFNKWERWSSEEAERAHVEDGENLVPVDIERF